jgi:adenylate cyclase class 2
MKKEIEVKAKVKDLKILGDKLESMGIILSDPIIQNDETFVDENFGNYGEFHSGKNVLRIRENNEKFIFTLKQSQDNELDCIEKETIISNPLELREALILMGYKSMVKIHKIRRKAQYGDYEICLDSVKELGDFIEVEIITDSQNSETTQNELFQFLESLGIKNEDRVINGYDTLIYNKKE